MPEDRPNLPDHSETDNVYMDDGRTEDSKVHAILAEKMGQCGNYLQYKQNTWVWMPSTHLKLDGAGAHLLTPEL